MTGPEYTDRQILLRVERMLTRCLEDLGEVEEQDTDVEQVLTHCTQALAGIQGELRRQLSRPDPLQPPF